MFYLGARHTPAPSTIRRLRDVASLHLMATPADVNWFAKCPADGDALGNDQVGDCDPVATLRIIQIRMANAWGSSWKPTKDMAFDLYQIFAGFNPVTLQPDDGTDTLKAMTIWVQQGVRIDSQNLDVPKWATVEPGDDDGVAKALSTTGPLKVTLALPQAAQDLSTWSKAPGTGTGWEAGSWGEHRAVIGAASETERVCRTWGIDVPMHPDFWKAYVIAVDATLSREWLNDTGLSPAGLDWNALEASVSALTYS